MDYRKENIETINAQPEVLTNDITEIQHSNSNSSDSFYLSKKISLMNNNKTKKCRKIKAVIRYIDQIKENNLNCFSIIYLCYISHGGMNLTSLEVIIHVSKFNEIGAQDIVEHNRAIFEPDSEAATEALEWLRNNCGTVTHSYDPINDQENAELELVFQHESLAN